MCGGEGQLEHQVVIQRLRVEDAVVRQDGVVQVDAILGTVDAIQGIFLIHPACLLVASARADLVQIIAMPSRSMFSLSSLVRKRSSKVL